MAPIYKHGEEDRKRVVSTHLVIKDLQKRIYELEQFA
jgi:hypothetical protein